MPDEISLEEALRVLHGFYRVKLIVVLRHKDEEEMMFASTIAETPAEIMTGAAQLAPMVLERLLRKFSA